MDLIKSFESYNINESLSSDLDYIVDLLTPGSELYDQLATKYYDLYDEYQLEIKSDDWLEEIEFYGSDPFNYVINLPELELGEFGKWVYDRWWYDLDLMMNRYGTEIPLMAIASYENTIRNEWLVHFTDNADSIVNNGFVYGVVKPEHLAYTENAEYDAYDRSSGGGWFFAYEASDVDYGIDGQFTKYGSEAIMFISSGVKIYHRGDNEPQVIFNGEYAKSIVPIWRSKDIYGSWYVSNKNGNKMYSGLDLLDVVRWVEKNFKLYKNDIVRKP
jgi:hypothetical protein